MKIPGIFFKKENKWEYTALIVVIIILLTVMAFWLRSFPYRFGELQALDPFYMYRMSEYMLEHNLELPERDMMRHYPFGASPRTQDPPIVFYLPVLTYIFFQFTGINGLFGMIGFQTSEFLNFAILWPAIIGTLSIPAIYFLGREILDKKTGIIAAFLLATVPAFITRTSAGFYEKEPISGVFMILAVYFFILAYRRNSWSWGIMAGLMMAILHLTWGGVQYYFLLFSGFTLLLLLINRFSMNLLKATSTTVLIGMYLPQLHPAHLDPLAAVSMFSTGVVALIWIRYLVQKFRIINKERLPYFTPALVILASIAFLIGTMFIDFLYIVLEGLIKAFFIQTSVAGSTVAEQAPGSWADVVRVTSNVFLGGNYGIFQGFADAILKPLAWLTHLYLLMIIGSLVLIFKIGVEVYRMIKAKESFLKLGSAIDPKKLLYIEVLAFVLFWNITSIWAVFGFIRLMFLLGPPMAIAGAIFITTLINRYRMHWPLFKVRENIMGKIKFYLPLGIVLLILFSTHLASAYTYSMSLGPSFNSYWREAMNYLATETPEKSNILSWWDFGYWFQTRGKRPSVSDGGGVGPRYDIAIWYMDRPANWSSYDSWLYDKYGVDYILQDYTLPGKYGAISKIGSQGARIDGFIQFGGNPSNVYQKGNVTIYEYAAGPYRLWIPVAGTSIVDSATLLISQNGQITSKVYINDFCSPMGLIKVGDKQPAGEGSCFAMTAYGMFFIPAGVRDTIFVNLQFMHGADLPVDKVFDNGVIQIYKVRPLNVSVSEEIDTGEEDTGKEETIEEILDPTYNTTEESGNVSNETEGLNDALTNAPLSGYV